MTKNQKKKKVPLWKRKLVLIPLILISLYTLAGFFLAPHIVKHQLVSSIDKAWGRKASLESVQINPYALTMVLRNFALFDADGEVFVTFEELFGNYQLFSLIRKVWNFKQIRLTRPVVNIRIDRKGRINFDDILTGAKSTRETSPETTGLMRLLFDRIKVISGSLNFVDHTRTGPFKMNVNPLDFTLTGFGTLPEQKGQHSLEAVFEQGGSALWEGELGVTPVFSKGRLEVRGFGAKQAWAYLRDELNFKILSGNVDLAMSYHFVAGTRRPSLSIDAVTAALRKLSVTYGEPGQSILEVPSVDIIGGRLRWPDQFLEIDRVTLKDVDLRAWLDERGRLNWQNLTKEEASQGGRVTDEPQDRGLDWKVVVKDLAIQDSDVHFEDRGTEQPVAVDLGKLNLKLQNLNLSPGTSTNLDLGFDVNRQGSVAVQGKFGTFPPWVDAALDIQGLTVLPFQPYLARVARLEMESGEVNLKGQLSYGDREGEPKLKLSGRMNIRNVATRDNRVDERLVAWEQLIARQLLLEVAPNRLEIGELEWIGPYGHVLIAEDQSLNLADIAIARDDGSATSADAVPESVSAAQTFPVAIGLIRIRAGSADFADLSLPLKFATHIHSLNGEVAGLSSNRTESATVALQGTVDQYGLAKISGEINPFEPDQHTHLGVDFSNIALTNLTPYSVKFAGYRIERGKMSLNLKYGVENRKLRGDNNIVLDQLTLGERVESIQSVDLPILLAVALLKDPRGVINVDLPISGDLDHPDFSYGGLIGQVVVNFIAKIITSPFRLLGALVGAESDNFEFVQFSPNSSEPPPPEREKLDKLPDALKQRPDLRIQISGRYEPGNDTLAMKNAKFTQRLTARMAQEMKKDTKESRRKAGTSGTQSALEAVYVDDFSASALEDLKNEYGLPPGANAGEREKTRNPDDKAVARATDMDKVNEVMRKQLIAAQRVTFKELRDLARARAESVKHHLVNTGGIEGQRIEILKPGATDKTDGEWIRSELELKV